MLMEATAILSTITIIIFIPISIKIKIPVSLTIFLSVLFLINKIDKKSRYKTILSAKHYKFIEIKKKN